MASDTNNSPTKDITDPLYDPYRRQDRFGSTGTAPMALSDQLLVAFFTVFVLPIRFILCMSTLIGCYLSCRIIQLLPVDKQPAVMASVGNVFCRLCLASIGIWIQWEKLLDDELSDTQFPCAVVSNHISWLDILVHMAHSFPSFVANASVRHLPFVGKISQMMNCIYVERENKKEGSQGISGIVREKMEKTFQTQSPYGRILLFPEVLNFATSLFTDSKGTTTNGQFILKFRRGAFLAGLPVQPVVLVYSSRWISPAWESISGKRHIRLILSFPFAKVRFLKLPVYVPSDEEKKDPDLFANNVRNFMIQASGIPFQKSDATIQHKREYHNLLRSQDGRHPQKIE